MAYFLFIDESGQDERASPCSVLAGVCIEDISLWRLIDDIISAENRFFGCRYGRIKEEFKGKKFLKRKVFHLAGREPAIVQDERRVLAYDCIVNGAGATPRHVNALAQAKLEFVDHVLQLVWCPRNNW